MKSVFADADYLVALLNPREELHEKAKRVSARLHPVRIITSEMVMAEMLVSQLRQNPNIRVVPQTATQFAEAMAFFCGHRDKEWSQTDCASFLIMRESGLSDALTYDHHFEQAGFTALLRGQDE